jgi:hypothetical protein
MSSRNWGQIPDLAPGDLAGPDTDGGRAWLTTLDSAGGPVTTVQPPGQFDSEALSWPHALRRYGGDQAAWPAS